MRTIDLKPYHVYRGNDGRTRKVLTVAGRGRNRYVRYRSSQNVPLKCSLTGFAEWAVEDITPAPTAMVR